MCLLTPKRKQSPTTFPLSKNIFLRTLPSPIRSLSTSHPAAFSLPDSKNFSVSLHKCLGAATAALLPSILTNRMKSQALPIAATATRAGALAIMTANRARIKRLGACGCTISKNRMRASTCPEESRRWQQGQPTLILSRKTSRFLAVYVRFCCLQCINVVQTPAGLRL